LAASRAHGTQPRFSGCCGLHAGNRREWCRGRWRFDGVFGEIYAWLAEFFTSNAKNIFVFRCGGHHQPSRSSRRVCIVSCFLSPDSYQTGVHSIPENILLPTPTPHSARATPHIRQAHSAWIMSGLGATRQRLASRRRRGRLRPYDAGGTRAEGTAMCTSTTTTTTLLLCSASSTTVYYSSLLLV
jgi:hypothetical protein